MLNHDFWKTFKAIDGERARFKKYARLSLCFLIFGAVLPISNPFIDFPSSLKLNKNTYDTTVNAISQTIVGTSASVLAACLIEIFSAMRIIWIKEEKRKSFMFFFGSDLDQGKAAIIIPKFDSTEISQLILPDKLPEVSLLHKFAGNADLSLLSFSDTKAAINIEILFEQNNFNRPELKFDDENINIDEYNTLFVIGLHSNSFLLNNINKKNTLFSLEKSEKVQNTKISKFKIADRSNGQQQPLSSEVTQEYSDDGSSQYGLIAKLKCNRTIIFVIGGNDADMTARCSTYLLEDWENIYKDEDTGCNPRIKFEDRIFAICMKHEININKPMTVVHKYAQNS
jgi:hypothetical protein